MDVHRAAALGLLWAVIWPPVGVADPVLAQMPRRPADDERPALREPPPRPAIRPDLPRAPVPRRDPDPAPKVSPDPGPGDRERPRPAAPAPAPRPGDPRAPRPAEREDPAVRRRVAEKTRLPEAVVARYGSAVVEQLSGESRAAGASGSLRDESAEQLKDRIYLSALARSLPSTVLDALAGRTGAHQAATGDQPSLVASPLRQVIPRDDLFAVVAEIPPSEPTTTVIPIRLPGTPDDRRDPPERGAGPLALAASPPPGRVPGQFYVYGFKDVVLLGRPNGRPCTATFVHEEWLVTAAHCVATWNPAQGARLIEDWRQLRVYRVLEGEDSAWWDARGFIAGPALRNTPSLGVGGIVVHTRWRLDSAYDVALLQVSRDGAARPPRVALLSAQEARDPQLTVAGYGDTSAARHPKGLEVGWPPTRLRDGLAYLSVRGGASNCLGDSGGPVFEGQQVGHADERHVLVAVISSRTVGSASGPCSGSLGHAVRLDRQDMTTWVCASTRDAIDGCRSRRSDALGGRTARARARAPQPAPAGRR